MRPLKSGSIRALVEERPEQRTTMMTLCARLEASPIAAADTRR